ncbi:MAG: hypothetical protein ACI87E_003284 [Mariniblastus sp.]|jgi:hypothetical protein
MAVMFGFLKPSCCDRQIRQQYRQVYAAFCAHHRIRYGVVASTLISYEAVFLYHLAIASGACSAPSPATPTCCKLRSDPTNRWNLDLGLADFCSDFGMLLVGVKIEDDARDGGGLVSGMANLVLRRKIAVAKERLDSVCPGMIKQLDRLVKTHVQSESDSQASMAIDRYANPTGDCFRLVFKAFGTLCQSRGGKNVEAFGMIGANVGQAILASDCCFDLAKDRERGEFNPIRSEHERVAATTFALQSLSKIGWTCSDLGASEDNQAALLSVPSTIARAAFQRVSNFSVRVETKHEIRLPLRARLNARAGFCDGCDGCDCGGDCDGCPSSDVAGEGPDFSCLGCPFCFDCCCLGVPGNDQKLSKNKGVEPLPQSNDFTDGAGEAAVGITVGPLNPMGMVRINDVDVPAKSQGQFVPGGTRVKVLRREAFGVVVEPVEG